jgi:hypothetical protein
MNKMNLLEELRTQRELIQKHLAWLDQKIAKLESDEPKSDAPAADDASKTQDTSPDDSKATHATNPPIAIEEEAEVAFGRYKAPAGDQVLRAKIGCLILFILGTLLFLFLLFGLPYLMD